MDQFATLMKVNENKAVEMFVYSSVTERVRVVSLTPRHWNGEGILGCQVSIGYGNPIPIPTGKKRMTLDEEDEFEESPKPIKKDIPVFVQDPVP